MLSRPDDACYCRCCCLSTDPAHSNDEPYAGRPYNRRYDCSCHQWWSGVWPPRGQQRSLDEWELAARMRARDLGNDALAESIPHLFAVLRDAYQTLTPS